MSLLFGAFYNCFPACIVCRRVMRDLKNIYFLRSEVVMLDKYEIPVVSGHNNPKKHREHAWE